LTELSSSTSLWTMCAKPPCSHAIPIEWRRDIHHRRRTARGAPSPHFLLLVV
jgi:hypothetical protein